MNVYLHKTVRNHGEMLPNDISKRSHRSGILRRNGEQPYNTRSDLSLRAFLAGNGTPQVQDKLFQMGYLDLFIAVESRLEEHEVLVDKL